MYTPSRGPTTAALAILAGAALCLTGMTPAAAVFATSLRDRGAIFAVLYLGLLIDRVGPELRICFAHGGGSFAFWLGRLENAWKMRPDVIATSEHPPSHYMGRFYVDSVVFDERPLRLLIDTVGVEHVVVGSDYPYPLGERPAGRVVREATSITAAERTMLLRTNAERFLGERSRP